ncbi:MAG: MoaD/ThiS family protein [Gammaproteobacteria bacterium]|nr:MoaD/ThiS family protein [Gammaproteobacteria bacterium]
MQVSVKLFGALRQFMPAGSAFNSCTLTVADNANLTEVLAALPIPPSKPYLVVFNDSKIDEESFDTIRVTAADKIILLPPVKGG